MGKSVPDRVIWEIDMYTLRVRWRRHIDILYLDALVGGPTTSLSA